MKEQERVFGLALFTLVIVSWISFTFHADSRFAGSLYGGILGIVAACLMLVTFSYSAVKRSPRLKKFITRFISMRTVVSLHIYLGIIAAILGLLHSGHKFESVLGIALTAVMLGVVLSGFIGYYIMSFISEERREKRITLSKLEQQYRKVALALSAHPEQKKLVRSLTHSWLTSLFASDSADVRLAKEAYQLSESISDVEYALQSHAAMKALFGKWTKIHIVLSFIFLILLVIHIWSSFYFGLRWLQ